MHHHMTQILEDTDTVFMYQYHGMVCMQGMLSVIFIYPLVLINFTYYEICLRNNYRYNIITKLAYCL